MEQKGNYRVLNRIGQKIHIANYNKMHSNLIWILIVILIIIAIFIYKFLLMPQINLKGDKTIVINYKEKYKEKGYKATFLGEDITKDVAVSGKVNSKKLGTYNITYTVKISSFTNKITRQVVVKDQSAPTIKLSSKNDIYVCPKKEYEEEKYSAVDNYDGDVTDKVKVIKKKDKIVYQVQDQAGNKKEVSRKIIYKDKTPPEITLEGGTVSYTFVGDNYKELGYKATDNCDGDITNKVKVSGTVDNNKAGEYSINYSLDDENGNNTTVTRKVIVSERGQNGTIYLTFDDGPKDGTTNVILDILKEEGVEATFFVTNSGPDELIKRAYDEGHSIALHTATHDYALVYSSVDNYFNDLLTVQERVKRITGYESKIIRFPGGTSNTISRRYSEGIMSKLTQEVLNRGFRYYDWNLSSNDAQVGEHTAEEIKNNVVSHLSKDRINMVLMHDIKPYTRDALREIIKYGKDNGYTFEKITMSTEMITQKVNN